MSGAGEALNVSRETLERLETYAELLKKWNPRINLVAKSTLDDLWTRHILDSLQVYEAAGTAEGKWVDLGSGGGFPGLVVAICAADQQPDLDVTLIESDQRKAAFLRSVLRETHTPGRVLAQRIEQADPQEADFLSARALADLGDLLGFAERHLAPEGITYFQKGARWKQEISAAETAWRFHWEAVESKTNPGAAILKIRGIARV
ncbi:16S rRNA (guanine(527)-N(7))-methyltransferase RsmG [Maritimibacter alkaliphilus]|nr:16S rRNA (guanine(527)-N(7))-methyltransferase RsmG [Maritimibacter alkaliphilus]